MSYTLDGATDLQALVTDLTDDGKDFGLGFDKLTAAVAVICAALLDGIPEAWSREQKETELFAAVCGIVAAGESEGILP